LKSEYFSFHFTKEEVQRYCGLAGVKKAIYYSLEAALEEGFEGIPLPPALPMIAYRHIEKPWQLAEPVILRKQECRPHRIMYADRAYVGAVKLRSHSFRQGRWFLIEELVIFDQENHLCFNGISHLIAGGFFENNTV